MRSYIEHRTPPPTMKPDGRDDRAIYARSGATDEVNCQRFRYSTSSKRGKGFNEFE